MRHLLATLSLSALMLCACSAPYKQPQMASAPSPDATFPGLVSLKGSQEPVDVLLVHGMCTHGPKWATDTTQALVDAMGGSSRPIELQPHRVPGTAIDLLQQTIRTPIATLRMNAVLWSGMTIPLKKQLCHDMTGQQAYCEPTDGKPYGDTRARINRQVKDTLLDDCLADAVIYAGDSRVEMSRQMQAAVMEALATTGGSRPAVADRTAIEALAAQPTNANLVVIAASLGSKIAFDALYKLATEGTSNEKVAVQRAFDRTSHLFLAANQMPMLGLANQTTRGGGPSIAAAPASAFPADPLAELIQQRRARKSERAAPLPSVVAFSDPNDLLSWTLVRSHSQQELGYPVVDVIVSNDTTAFGLLENPYAAHSTYLVNPAVQQLIACGTPDRCGRQ